MEPATDGPIVEKGAKKKTKIDKKEKSPKKDKKEIVDKQEPKGGKKEKAVLNGLADLHGLAATATRLQHQQPSRETTVESYQAH